MPTPVKEKAIAELHEKIGKAKSLLLTDFSGMNVEQMHELRTQLRKSSIEYKVVKNSLARISVEQLGMQEVVNFLDGPTAIALGMDDPLAPAKIITEYVKKNAKLKIKAYILEGKAYEGEQIEKIAKLPPREVLIAQLLGTMSAPISNVIFSLQNLLQKTVYVINEIKAKKEQQ
jgi:large subunit ribosomal protein L10